MKTIIKHTLLLLILAILSTGINAQKKPELASSPPMGWNSWNWHGKPEINEKVVMQTIDAMVYGGLLDAGYNYLVIDGGWRDTKLGPKGELLAHPQKFPGGIKMLADYAHSRGMKLGVHVVPGTHDCGGDPVGGFNREEIHVNQFVEWELDFIKLDLCTQKEDPCEACQKTRGGWSETAIEDSYRKWSRLLNQCERDILFSISAYQYRNWYPEVCNMARTTGDIQSRIHKGGAMFNPPEGTEMVHYSVMDIAESNNISAEHAGNGYWNDPDMLVTGEHGMTEAEQESHFALWCIMSSPLILGNDPRSMTEFEKELILNEEMIAVNQDPTEQGKLVKSVDNTQVWIKNLQDGKKAVLLLNLDTTGKRDIQVKLNEIGFKGEVTARDLIGKKDLGSFNGSISLSAETNQCHFLLLAD
ncbi:glycoside hydrolase family 27 protein [Bacteroidota bacterium]